MMCLGMIVFPGYYAWSAWLFQKWVDTSMTWLIAYIISLPLTGYFALHYAWFVGQAQSFLKMHQFNRQEADRLSELKALHRSITQELDLTRANYLKRL